MTILNEAHLRAVLTEYARYYNAERPHRALELHTPVQHIRPVTGPIRASPSSVACTTSIGELRDGARLRRLRTRLRATPRRVPTG